MKHGLHSSIIIKYFEEGYSKDFLKQEQLLLNLVNKNHSNFVVFEDNLLTYLKFCFTDLKDVKRYAINLGRSLPDKEGMIANEDFDKYTKLYNDYLTNFLNHFNGFNPKLMSSTHKNYIEDIKRAIDNHTEEEKI